MLESLEQSGVLRLPHKVEHPSNRGQNKLQWSVRSEAQSDIDDDLEQLTPIGLWVVSDPPQIREWNEWVDRYHYLGYKRAIGCHLRYFVVDRQDRKLGCLMFSYAVKSLPCRDEWIGWQDQSYKKHLERVVNNNRFLILPWVKVTNLASKVLSMACRQLPVRWQRHHGYRPVLMETFVDPSQFNATSYRAANWLFIGNTQPRSGKTQKQVYVTGKRLPLNPDAGSAAVGEKTGEVIARATDDGHANRSFCAALAKHPWHDGVGCG